ncbi:hypothetical protein [uncultured Limimaricola sp.]|uniref:hypothetical protein n=1 Tax=uncultured Limimaricola sp. TaxID=2211667 RepID=UPI0030F570B8
MFDQRNALRGCFVSITMLFASQVSAQNCDIRAFQARTLQFLDQYQALAYAENVTREHHSELQAGGDGDLTIGGIEIGASYDEFRRNIEIFKRDINLSTFESYQQTFFTTSLSENGLNAYIACLGLGRVELVAAHLPGNVPDVTIVSRPSPGMSLPKPEITDVENIDNIDAIEATIGAASFGSAPVTLERIRLRHSDADEPLLLTLSFGDVSDTVTFPPLNLPREATPPPPESVCLQFKATGAAGPTEQPEICASESFSSNWMFIGDDTGYKNKMLKISSVESRTCFQHQRRAANGTILDTEWVCSASDQASPYVPIGDDTGYRDQKLRVRWDGKGTLCIDHTRRSPTHGPSESSACSNRDEASQWINLGDDTGYRDQRLRVSIE